MATHLGYRLLGRGIEYGENDFVAGNSKRREEVHRRPGGGHGRSTLDQACDALVERLVGDCGPVPLDQVMRSHRVTIRQSEGR